MWVVRPCLCVVAQELAARIKQHGVIRGAEALSTDQADLCLSFAENYVSSQSLIIGSSGAVSHAHTAHARAPRVAGFVSVC